MKRVLASIEGSAERHPRDVYILYIQPLNRQVFDQAPTMRLVADRGRYALYQAQVPKPEKSAAL